MTKEKEDKLGKIKTSTDSEISTNLIEAVREIEEKHHHTMRVQVNKLMSTEIIIDTGSPITSISPNKGM